jgi:hypothetical protein
MTELSPEKVHARKLAHAYIALALAQDEAKRYVSQHSAYAALHPLLTTLDVTAELLEEILQDVLPAEEPIQSPSIACSDLLM